MKKHFVLVIALVLAYGVAQASPSDYGISIGYGSADTNIDIYRVGLQKDFSSKWFETRVGYLTGYFELSYNYWESESHDKTNGIALSPVFTYYFGSSANSIKPYIEGGIGVAYIDDYMIDGRNLATNFQFEDRLGAGIRFKQIDVSARYMHYSNCSVKSPNDGIDIFICSISYRFKKKITEGYMKEKYLPGLLFLLVSVLMLSCATGVLAADKKDMGGWGIDDAYNKMYNAGDVEKMKVVVTDIKEVVPMPGMSPGVALIVREGDDEEEMLVHLCPVWYKKANRTGIRKGDKLKLRGYFTEIDGKEVIMAAKIKFNGKAFKVRLSSDGTPFWTMTPAQLQKELSDE